MKLAPGPAVNLAITETYQDGFKATWCPPLNDPQCAETWTLSTEVFSDMYGNIQILSEKQSWKYEAFIGDDLCQVVEERELSCGTRFKFIVAAVSPSGLKGEEEFRIDETKPC